jgi:hypothetical protein
MSSKKNVIDVIKTNVSALSKRFPDRIVCDSIPMFQSVAILFESNLFDETRVGSGDHLTCEKVPPITF